MSCLWLQAPDVPARGPGCQLCPRRSLAVTEGAGQLAALAVKGRGGVGSVPTPALGREGRTPWGCGMRSRLGTARQWSVKHKGDFPMGELEGRGEGPRRAEGPARPSRPPGGGAPVPARPAGAAAGWAATAPPAGEPLPPSPPLLCIRLCPVLRSVWRSLGWRAGGRTWGGQVHSSLCGVDPAGLDTSLCGPVTQFLPPSAGS